MILCSCNVLTCHAVREVLGGPNPPRTPAQVHRHLGCKPQCGRCLLSIREILDEEQHSGSADTDASSQANVA
jgi:bacterioferritin-associated ferredoxin